MTDCTHIQALLEDLFGVLVVCAKEGLGLGSPDRGVLTLAIIAFIEIGNSHCSSKCHLFYKTSKVLFIDQIFKLITLLRLTFIYPYSELLTHSLKQ